MLNRDNFKTLPSELLREIFRHTMLSDYPIISRVNKLFAQTLLSNIPYKFKSYFPFTYKSLTDHAEPTLDALRSHFASRYQAITKDIPKYQRSWFNIAIKGDANDFIQEFIKLRVAHTGYDPDHPTLADFQVLEQILNLQTKDKITLFTCIKEKNNQILLNFIYFHATTSSSVDLLKYAMACKQSSAHIISLLDKYSNQITRQRGKFIMRFAIKQNSLDIVKKLIELDNFYLHPGENEEEKYHPLISAMEYKNYSMVNWLLENGKFKLTKQINYYRNNEKLHLNLLQLAIIFNCVDLVRCYVDADKKLLLLKYEDRLMHLAVKSKSLEMVNLLIELGISCNEVDDQERTPLHIAAQLDCANMIQILCDTNELAAQLDCEDIIDYDYHHGEYVNYVDSEGHTALQIAIQNNHRNFVRTLVDRYPDVIKWSNINDDNALMLAAKCGSIETFEYFLETNRFDPTLNVHISRGKEVVSWTPLNFLMNELSKVGDKSESFVNSFNNLLQNKKLSADICQNRYILQQIINLNDVIIFSKFLELYPADPNNILMKVLCNKRDKLLPHVLTLCDFSFMDKYLALKEAVQNSSVISIIRLLRVMDMKELASYKPIFVGNLCPYMQYIFSLIVRIGKNLNKDDYLTRVKLFGNADPFDSEKNDQINRAIELISDELNKPHNEEGILVYQSYEWVGDQLVPRPEYGVMSRRPRAD